MKINASQIQYEGLALEEQVSAGELDLESESVTFPGPIKIRVEVSKVLDTVTAAVHLSGKIKMRCSRCLNEVEIGFNKNLKLNYPVSKTEQVIDLNPDIREEIILDYPLKPLCSPDCKGLCPKCGKNLNEGGCSCGST